jgi:hypothetical protein
MVGGGSEWGGAWDSEVTMAQHGMVDQVSGDAVRDPGLFKLQNRSKAGAQPLRSLATVSLFGRVRGAGVPEVEPMQRRAAR